MVHAGDFARAALGTGVTGLDFVGMFATLSTEEQNIAGDTTQVTTTNQLNNHGILLIEPSAAHPIAEVDEECGDWQIYAGFLPGGRAYYRHSDGDLFQLYHPRARLPCGLISDIMNDSAEVLCQDQTPLFLFYVPSLAQQVPALAERLQVDALAQRLENTPRDTGETHPIETRVHIARFETDTMEELMHHVLEIHGLLRHRPGFEKIVFDRAVCTLADGVEVPIGHGTRHQKYADRVVWLEMHMTR
ncbi:hypothetical protein FN846DRAFT_910519 [Sphaerosporella brunnea]|uniref:Uncharacterized protein n=1 Tax=Sphaerosporella brunnea TaxID=1250544 RepID=A0A5J5EMU3_9PEZI|nr:hypothetical protein FN846DRAFT_910519 [Sphaerosporella brunnea]